MNKKVLLVAFFLALISVDVHAGGLKKILENGRKRITGRREHHHEVTEQVSPIHQIQLAIQSDSGKRWFINFPFSSQFLPSVSLEGAQGEMVTTTDRTIKYRLLGKKENQTSGFFGLHQEVWQNVVPRYSRPSVQKNLCKK
jgi:hypothetical protein